MGVRAQSSPYQPITSRTILGISQSFNFLIVTHLTPTERSDLACATLALRPIKTGSYANIRSIAPSTIGAA